jgi:hypothetical protein
MMNTISVQLRPVLTLRECVTEGVLWLDEKAPGWAERVDLSLLDMKDPQRCIIGQVFRGESFGYALASRGVRAWGFSLGFDRRDSEPSWVLFPFLNRWWPRGWEGLTRLWRAEITQRLERPQ